MTFRMALKHIRRNVSETEETFRIIYQNRYCHSVRDWAIYNLMKHEKLSHERKRKMRIKSTRQFKEWVNAALETQKTRDAENLPPSASSAWRR